MIFTINSIPAVKDMKPKEVWAFYREVQAGFYLQNMLMWLILFIVMTPLSFLILNGLSDNPVFIVMGALFLIALYFVVAHLYILNRYYYPKAMKMLEQAQLGSVKSA